MVVHGLLTLVLLAGCSSSSPLKFWKKKGPPKSSTVKRVEIIPGPTQPVGPGFVDKTDQYGLGHTVAVHLYAVDFNHDGYTDLVTLPTFFDFPQFYVFEPVVKKFIPLSQSPFQDNPRASFLNFADLNKDGVTDVLLGSLAQGSGPTDRPVKVYAGKLKDGQITYELQSQAFPYPATPNTSLSLIDVDLDGYLDLFQGNWVGSGGESSDPMAHHVDRLYLFHPPKKKGQWGSFVEASYLLKGEDQVQGDDKILVNARPTFGSSTCDIDLDGHPDILTTSTNWFGNKLWLNRYDLLAKRPSFINVAKDSGYEADSLGALTLRGGGNSFFSACADYNNDGIMDIYVGELFHHYDHETKDRSSLLTGTSSRDLQFFRTELMANYTEANWTEAIRRAVWHDLNFDGLLDLLVVNSGYPPHTRLVLFEQTLGKSFVDTSAQRGINILGPYGSIVMDLNDDGRPDIVTGQTNVRASYEPRVYVFENAIPQKSQRLLKLYLRGALANTQGIGARLLLTTTKTKRTHWMEFNQGGLSSQNEEGAFFALDSDEFPLTVKVFWPYINKRTATKGRDLLVHTYSFKKFKPNAFMKFTLCDSGKMVKGKRSGCP